MEKRYVARYIIVDNEPTKDYFTANEEDLKIFIKRIETQKEIYESVIIYEEATGEAVYYYKAKKEMKTEKKPYAVFQALHQHRF